MTTKFIAALQKLNPATPEEIENFHLEKAERQSIFESIRHYVSCKHQVPQHLSAADLMQALSILIGEKQ